MSLTIGFSVEAKELATPASKELLQAMLDADCNALQIHGHSDLLGLEVTNLQLVRQFSYRAIHLPELHGSEQDKPLIEAAKKLGEKILVMSYVLHPTGMDSFRWLNNEFGDLLSIENMDWRKTFGKKPEDLQQVFHQLPNAGWTFDPNHIKTNDPTMHLADDFYKALQGKLRNYHLSGFVDESLPHTLLADTRQDEIIAQVRDLSKPIILESIGTQDYWRFKEELDYVLPRLQNKNA